MKSLIKFAVSSAAAAVAVAGLTGCGSGPATVPSGSPSQSTPSLNSSDARAIIGAAIIVQQAPPKGSAVLAYVKKLAATKKNPAKPQVDMGYPGNILLSYYVTSDGNEKPVCATVRFPDGDPTQKSWAAYYSPAGSAGKSGMLVVGPKITNCDEAKKVVDETGSDDNKREIVNSQSLALVAASYGQVPYSELTPGSLRLLDQLRAAAAQASSSASPKP